MEKIVPIASFLPRVEIYLTFNFINMDITVDWEKIVFWFGETLYFGKQRK